MVVLYPLVLAVVVLMLWRRRGEAGARGWRWFGWWMVAGAVFTFSFLTGFSIGLFVLPFAATLLLWLARRAPRLPETLGFVAGVGAPLLVVAYVNRGEGGFDSGTWLIAGLLVTVSGLSAYGVVRSRGR